MSRMTPRNLRWPQRLRLHYVRPALPLLAVSGAFLLSLCSPATGAPAKDVPGGDPQRGQLAIGKYGCPACHVIPGVVGARGKVGPSLQGIASRAAIAGHLSNTPENLMHWIQSPQSVEPGTIMPNMGVTEADARDIAAYLYTLR